MWWGDKTGQTLPPYGLWGKTEGRTWKWKSLSALLAEGPDLGLAGGGWRVGGSWHLGSGSSVSPAKTEEVVGSLGGLVSAVSQVGGPAQPIPLGPEL